MYKDEKCDYNDLPPVENKICLDSKYTAGDPYKRNKEICDNLEGSESGWWIFTTTSKGFTVSNDAQCQADCKAAGGADYDMGCFYQGYPVGKTAGQMQYCCLCINSKGESCPKFQ